MLLHRHYLQKVIAFMAITFNIIRANTRGKMRNNTLTNGDTSEIYKIRTSKIQIETLVARLLFSNFFATFFKLYVKIYVKICVKICASFFYQQNFIKKCSIAPNQSIKDPYNRLFIVLERREMRQMRGNQKSIKFNTVG